MFFVLFYKIPEKIKTEKAHAFSALFVDPECCSLPFLLPEILKKDRAHPSLIPFGSEADLAEVSFNATYSMFYKNNIRLLIEKVKRTHTSNR